MAQLVITYWRDIPSQVAVKLKRKTEKRMLSERFQEAIDMAAMRSGAAETDAYLEEWRRGEPTPCDDDIVAAVEQAVKDIENQFDKEKLIAFVKNGGYDKVGV